MSLEAEIFTEAARIAERTPWWRGAYTEEAMKDETSTCIWIATTNAYTAVTDEAFYSLDAKVPSLKYYLAKGVAAVDPDFDASLTDDEIAVTVMAMVFEWNDHKATSKEQVVEALEKAAELALTDASA